MPIIVPDPSTVQVNRTAELAMHRKNTEWFIAWNPTDLVLIPKVKVKAGTGTKVTDGTARAVQRMRLIPQAETTPPFTTPDGVERVVSYVLLGLWGCVMAIGDHWRDVNGFYHEVLDITSNGYEVKGLVEKHGAS